MDNPERKGRKKIPLKIVSKRIKYLKINLPKEMKYLCVFLKLQKHWWHKEDMKKSKAICVHELEDLILSRCQYYSKSVDFMQFL